MPQNEKPITPIRSSRWILFHFSLLVAAVVIYNRVVYALHTVSGNSGFSSWAAPLYAFSQPIPKITADALLRWITPIVIAVVWIGLTAKWMRSRSISTASQMRIAIGMAILLNLTTAMMDQGIKSISAPFAVSQEDFYPDAAHVTDPLRLLREYPMLNVGRHPKTHPPGGVLLLWVVRKTIGDGVMTASLFAVIVTALTLIPATLTCQKLIGERATFIFIALYVLTPNLIIFGATSMDGVFAFFLNWTVYLFFWAATHPTPRWWRGIILGISLALSTFMTYASIALVALMIVWWVWQWFDKNAQHQIFGILITAAITTIACFALLYLCTGCNILACVRASMRFDATMMHAVRHQYLDQSLTNLFGFLVGSGLIASTLWLRDAACDFASIRRPSPIAGVLLLTVVVLSFSTLFTRELERIWMFLTPLLLMGAARNLDRLTPQSARKCCTVVTMILLFLQAWLTQLLLYTLW